jgi:polyhydroxybutyrate depolymerase
LYSTPVQAQEKGITYKVEKRRYIVYTPNSYASNLDKKYASVLNFHGVATTAREKMLYTQMNEATDRFDFIEVYPQGLGNDGKQDWNVGFVAV